MARARRKPKSKSRRSSSGLGIFVMGLITGSIGTVLGLGFFEDHPLDDVGSGLGSLLNQPAQTAPPAPQPQTGKVTEAIPDFKFNYRELLLEEEYVLPLPPREKAADTEDQTSTEPESIAAAPTATEEAPAAAQTATDPTPAAAEQPPAPKPVADDGSAFVIQIGSYRKFEDADRIKATLALNGFEVYIQKVSIEGRGDFFRVRMGPFREYEAVESATDSLTKLDLQPLVFRVRTSG